MVSHATLPILLHAKPKGIWLCYKEKLVKYANSRK